MDELVETLVAEMTPFLDRPYALLGNSVGALIAFALAQRFQANGPRRPAALVVCSSRAPQMSARSKLTREVSEDDFLHWVKRYGGIPPTILESPGALKILLPTMRADFELAEAYVFEAEIRLSCRLTALAGAQDQTILRAEVEEWGSQTSGPFSARFMPGDHFFFRAAYADVLRAVVEDLQASSACASASGNLNSCEGHGEER